MKIKISWKILLTISSNLHSQGILSMVQFILKIVNLPTELGTSLLDSLQLSQPPATLFAVQFTATEDGTQRGTGNRC